MLIRKATADDIDGIEILYKEVVKYLERHKNYPGWNSEYPGRSDAEEALAMDSLYVAINKKAGDIAGTFMLKHRPEPGYETADWGNNFTYEEIYVVNTFAVRPEYFGKKVGDRMMEFVLEEARRDGMKAVRLDVVDGNKPAIKLYQRKGFQYIGTIDEGLGEYGLPWFQIYQYVL